MKSMISRSVLWAGLFLLLIAAAISVGQSASTMFGDAEAQALILKKPRLTRIGIALPKADLGQGFPGPTAGESLQILVSRYLGGPNIEVVTLAALLGSQVEAEAKEKGCDYVVYSAMTQKKIAGWAFSRPPPRHPV